MTRTATDDTPRGRANTRSGTGDIALLRRSAPERSPLTPAGLRVLPIPGRDATPLISDVAITMTITPTAACIAPTPACNAPLAIGDTPIGTRITHAGL